MRPIANMMRRLQQMPRLRRILTDSKGLINTIDLLVATGATVILAAGVGGAAIATLNDAKYGKAQPDAQSLGNAITQFYKDTGTWPGQGEQASWSGAAKPAQFLVTSTSRAFLPSDFTSDNVSTLSVANATCENNSLQGFIGKTITGATLSADNVKNINDYLVRKPNDTLYPNWKGPYIQEDIKTDPWDRAWVMNLQPLYCSENITPPTSTGGSTDTAGHLGYAWLLSGGANRTITTFLTAAHLDASGDDAGVNLGKRVKPGTNGSNAQ